MLFKNLLVTQIEQIHKVTDDMLRFSVAIDLTVTVSENLLDSLTL